MKFTLLLVTITLTTTSIAQQTYAAKTFALPCDKVQPTAVFYIQHTGLALSPDITCNHCFMGITAHLRDPQGHTVSTKTVIKLYTDLSKTAKNSFGAWSIPNGLETTARLYFEQNQSTCTAHLLFAYSWNASKFIGAMPANDDQVTSPSNLHLEDEYLDAIAQAILASSPPVQTLSSP